MNPYHPPEHLSESDDKADNRLWTDDGVWFGVTLGIYIGFSAMCLMHILAKFFTDGQWVKVRCPFY